MIGGTHVTGKPIALSLEVGEKKAFAVAIDWPGWTRSGKDVDSAVENLLAYAPRYARIFSRTTIDFTPPGDVAGFTVEERHKGNSATEFGVAGIETKYDTGTFTEADRDRSLAILDAIWHTFDRVVDSAEGHPLRKGPRGGGRDRDKIVLHVVESAGGYLTTLGWKYSFDTNAPLDKENERLRNAIRDGLDAGVKGELPEKGPRGGKVWSPRYFVRRLGWHIMDHVWEIEDRIQKPA